MKTFQAIFNPNNKDTQKMYYFNVIFGFYMNFYNNLFELFKFIEHFPKFSKMRLLYSDIHTPCPCVFLPSWRNLGNIVLKFCIC